MRIIMRLQLIGQMKVSITGNNCSISYQHSQAYHSNIKRMLQWKLMKEHLSICTTLNSMMNSSLDDKELAMEQIQDGACYFLKTHLGLFYPNLASIFCVYQLIHRDLVNENDCNFYYCHSLGSRFFTKKFSEMIKSEHLQTLLDRRREGQTWESLTRIKLNLNIEHLTDLSCHRYFESLGQFEFPFSNDYLRYREHQTCNQENAGPNPLLDDIESTDTITNLFTNMFETRTESFLVNGIQVIQALLEYRHYRANLSPKQPPVDEETGAESKIEIGDIGTMEKIVSYPMFSVNETALPDLMTPLDIKRLTKNVRQVHAAIVPRLEDFNSLLTNPSEKSPVRTTIGLIEKPFGATRVEVVHLIRALLSSNNPTINRKLTTLKTLPVLMDLFFAYPYNNFLHTQVEQSINCILDNPKSTSPWLFKMPMKWLFGRKKSPEEMALA
uniref:Uncharacterized protein n=1 Tax=Tetranychus urticae TaxID=32264 RepID=T1K5T3_TETUR